MNTNWKFSFSTTSNSFFWKVIIVSRGVEMIEAHMHLLVQIAVNLFQLFLLEFHLLFIFFSQNWVISSGFFWTKIFADQDGVEWIETLFNTCMCETESEIFLNTRNSTNILSNFWVFCMVFSFHFFFPILIIFLLIFDIYSYSSKCYSIILIKFSIIWNEIPIIRNRF